MQTENRAAVLWKGLVSGTQDLGELKQNFYELLPVEGAASLQAVE